MLDRILRARKNSDFDFRRVANPQHRLPEQLSRGVPHYRLIAAVGEVLQPQAILGINDRYGGAGAALCYGSPKAEYTSIIDGANGEGDLHGAEEQARSILPAERSRVIIADVEKGTCFPGGIYDLIYIAGRQNEENTYSHLDRAINQGHHILVDGAFQTRDGFLCTAEFLFRHRDVVDHVFLIPDSAGQILINVSKSHLERAGTLHQDASSSSALIPFYDSQYYLADCGGFASFNQTNGKSINSDERLATMLQLASLNQGGRLLDLGCGRGEITYQAAKQGMRVTAVDYSPDAIDIARTCFQDERDLESHVEWVCGSAADLQLHGRYSTVVAGDLVEHMTPGELDRMYGNLASHLEATGLFIVHTFPNKWFYQYDYPRRRRQAAELGAYLSPQPRTRYEMLMHINEQSPRVLKRQLSRYFKHVLLWFANPDDPGGSLLRNCTRRQLTGLRDLFAIASHHSIDVDRVAAIFQMRSLTDAEASRVTLELRRCPRQIPRSSLFDVAVRLHNGTTTTLSSGHPHPIHVAYHWLDARSHEVIVFDGQRSKLWSPLQPGDSGDYQAVVEAPGHPNRCLLQMRLVQERVRWHDRRNGDARQDCTVTVT